MGKEELYVFVSSDQIEFSKLRTQLANEICNIPFLSCELLEESGADASSVLEASLKAVRNSDVYVGVFGREYSEITIKEYQEAVNAGMPCYTYVRKLQKRDEELEKFINATLKNDFKYYIFKKNKELIHQLNIDLRKFVLETLEMGLEERKRKKKETIALLLKEEKTAPKAMAKKDPLNEAEIFFRKGKYLECIVTISVIIETSLRKFLETKGLPSNILTSLGKMITFAQESEFVNHDDIFLLRRISVSRSAAVHLGKAPDQETVQGLLDSARYLLSVLKSKGKAEKITRSTNTLWKPLPKVDFKVAQTLLRTLHFPTVGWEAYNNSPYQLGVRIEVHPILGGRDLHPLSDDDINGKNIYLVEPFSYVFANGCFTLPRVCAEKTDELILEIRATVEDMLNLEKGLHNLLPKRWKYVREKNIWSYYPQQAR